MEDSTHKAIMDACRADWQRQSESIMLDTAFKAYAIGRWHGFGWGALIGVLCFGATLLMLEVVR